jgi:hypothetical protein
MEEKRDEITAIDALNTASKYLWKVQAVAESLSYIGMVEDADNLYIAINAIEELLVKARGDISAGINSRYDQSMQDLGDILKACLKAGDKNA